MKSEIKHVTVIGSGTMGAAIAAHFANTQTPVSLLCLTEENSSQAIARMLKQDPSPFVSPQHAKYISAGKIDTAQDIYKKTDWIIEAIIEDLDIKQNLYQKLFAEKSSHTVISSNTSTLPLKLLSQKLDTSQKSQFFISHFFNPPRYMRLLELVFPKDLNKEDQEKISYFAEYTLGKEVVLCQDTPGFIANRIGIFWLMKALEQAQKLDISPQEADFLLSKPFGIPKTGVFALLDLIGLDLAPHIMKSMNYFLPPEDAFKKITFDSALIQKMIDQGYTGRKGKGGFYRLNEKREKEVFHLKTGQYHRASKKKLPFSQDIQSILQSPAPYSTFVKDVMEQTFSYAASILGQATSSIYSIDLAMKYGFNWKYGIFELLDSFKPDIKKLFLQKSSPSYLSQDQQKKFYDYQDSSLQYRNTQGTYEKIVVSPQNYILKHYKLNSSPLLKNQSASLWDIGDGIACLEFHSKMNAIDLNTLQMTFKAVDFIEETEKFKGLVLYNDSSNFSIGANLVLGLFAANIAAWDTIDLLVKDGQKALKKLKYAPFPVVAAPTGLALGGGCEYLLHADRIVAHVELYTGLVETGVGLIPAWGGCGQLMANIQNHPHTPKGPMPAVMKAFELIAQAQTSKSAHEAKNNFILRPEDKIVFQKNHLLSAAKSEALRLVPNYTPPEKISFSLPGATGESALQMALEDFRIRGIATPHDLIVGKYLGHILCGGKVADVTEKISEEMLLNLENHAFIALMQTEPTLARIEHILSTGKPLRN